MRMTLCWSDISGYITSCWRALAAVPGVELKVIAFKPPSNFFDNALVRGIDCILMPEDKRNDVDYVRRLILDSQPDVLYFTGWFHRPYRKAIFARELDHVSKWIGVDTPWVGNLKQQVGRIVLRKLIARLDRVFVAGERSWQYLRMMGTPQRKVRRGLYGVDYDSFRVLHERRVQQPGGWPRKFLYTGRYAPEKGLDNLMDAYAKYRTRVSEPWPLGCCGGGPEKAILQGKAGVEDYGFQQPAQLMDVMSAHGAFVLPSHFDPWPLVVVEASAAGLPVLCTEACGSAVELVRPYYNGITVATRDVDALADAFAWAHQQTSEQLAEMGRRGRELAAAYSAQMWAQRWAQAARECMVERGKRTSASLAT
jgi:glycosyltransferase involved in cell wall biosynthesis